MRIDVRLPPRSAKGRLLKRVMPLLLIVACLGLVACEPARPPLVGTWTVTQVQPERRTALTYQFAPDGRVVIGSSLESSGAIQSRYAVDGDRLSITSTGDSDATGSLQWVTRDRFFFEYVTPSGETKRFDFWRFKQPEQP